MPRFVAFLGGINVGGHRVTMDRLRGEFAALGFDDVDTFIASGNVLFSASGSGAAIESRIEQHLGEQLRWNVPTFVRQAREVTAIVEFAATEPFGAIADDHTHMVALTAAIDDERMAAIVGQSTPANRFHVQGREVHWAIAGRLSASAITLPKLTKLIGRNTTRNLTSLRRLADRL